MLNPKQIAQFVNDNIKSGIVYNEKSIQRLVWVLLKERYLIDPLQEVVIDTVWTSIQILSILGLLTLWATLREVLKMP